MKKIVTLALAIALAAGSVVSIGCGGGVTAETKKTVSSSAS